jgi:hypothetical protein
LGKQAVGVQNKTDKSPQAGAPDKTEERRPVDAPDKTVEGSQAKEQTLQYRRGRVRFYTGLLTLIGAVLFGVAYIPSKRLSRLLLANALALVSIWTSFGPIVRARFSRTAQP